MKKYTYKHRATGRIVQSDTPLSRMEYVLVSQLRNGKMKSNQIITK